MDTQILDDVVWTAPIIFAVERSTNTVEEIASISYLILRTIGIHPNFAADLIAVASPEVWQAIAPTVHEFVEEWRATAKDRAVQFVLR